MGLLSAVLIDEHFFASTACRSMRDLGFDMTPEFLVASFQRAPVNVNFSPVVVGAVHAMACDGACVSVILDIEDDELVEEMCIHGQWPELTFSFQLAIADDVKEIHLIEPRLSFCAQKAWQGTPSRLTWL